MPQPEIKLFEGDSYTKSINIKDYDSEAASIISGGLILNGYQYGGSTNPCLSYVTSDTTITIDISHVTGSYTVNGYWLIVYS